MSSVTAELSTAVATIWRANNKDQFGRTTYQPPLSFECILAYNKGREYTSQRGIKIVPAFTVWFEKTALPFVPNDGDFVVSGDQTASSLPSMVNGALPIRDVAIENCSLFNEEDDVRLLC